MVLRIYLILGLPSGPMPGNKTLFLSYQKQERRGARAFDFSHFPIYSTNKVYSHFFIQKHHYYYTHVWVTVAALESAF